MSPHVGNFVQDLVEMAKATEELPKVQAELAEARLTIHNQAEAIGTREERILGLKAEIDSLHSKIREAEQARDKAELMFLEADDRTEKALAFVRSVFGNAGALIQALEPPKPEPVPVVPAEVAVQSAEQVSGVSGEGQSVAAPIHGDAASTSQPSTPQTADSSSVVEPTSAPSDPATASSDGSGGAPAIGDPEPKQYEDYGHKVIRQEWWDWYDRQSYEFKQNYAW